MRVSWIAAATLAMAIVGGPVAAADKSSDSNQAAARSTHGKQSLPARSPVAPTGKFSILRNISVEPMKDVELSSVRGAHSTAGISGVVVPPGLDGANPTDHAHDVVTDAGGNHPPSVANDQVTEIGLADKLPPQVAP
jgi:hypothetical protein